MPDDDQTDPMECAIHDRISTTYPALGSAESEMFAHHATALLRQMDAVRISLLALATRTMDPEHVEEAVADLYQLVGALSDIEVLDACDALLRAIDNAREAKEGSSDA